MSEPVSSVWQSASIDILVKSLILCLVAGIGAFALRRASAAWRHLAWTLVPCGLLLLPLLTLGLPVWKLPIGPAKALPTASSWIATPLHASSELTPSRFSQPEAVAVQETVIPTVQRPDLPLSSPAAAEVTHSSVTHASFARNLSAHSALILTLLWMVGAAAASLQVWVGLWRVQRLRRTSVPLASGEMTQTAARLMEEVGVGRPVTLLLAHNTLLPPMTWGFLRPVVLLPSDATAWSADRLRAVLLHELAHIRRADWLTQSLAQCVCALYWFHPLVWWAARQQRLTSERAADDQVLALGVPPTDYAAHLLETIRTLSMEAPRMHGTVTMAQRPPFEGRLRAILNPRCRRETPSRIRALSALLLAFGLLLSLASMRVGARQTGLLPISPAPALTLQPPRDPSPSLNSAPTETVPALTFSNGGPESSRTSETAPTRPTADAPGVYRDPTSTVALDAEADHVVWGKVLKGLQLGVVVPPKGFTVPLGQRLTLRVRLRNVGAAALTLSLIDPRPASPFFWNVTTQNSRELVISHDSATQPGFIISYNGAPKPPVATKSLTLMPGEERPLPGPPVQLQLQEMGNSAVSETTAFVTPGKCTVRILPFTGAGHRSWLALASTGTFEIMVLSGPMQPTSLPAQPKMNPTLKAVPTPLIGWGQPHNGLQAGLFLTTPQRPYTYGETITFQMRLRNVTAASITTPLGIPTRRNASLHEENGITLFSYGTEKADLTLLPGEERDVPGQRYRFELRPPDWDGDLQANPETPPMQLVPGHFRVKLPFPGFTTTTRGRGILIDTTMTEIPAPPGLAEFELRAQSGTPDPIGPAANLAPILDVKSKIVWGKPVNGLSLGIGFATDNALFHEGEEVKLNAYIRNTTNRPLTFTSSEYPKNLVDPRITGGKWNQWIPILTEVKTGSSSDMFPVLSLTLQPGETQQAAQPHFTILRDGRPYRHSEAVFIAGPGKYHLDFERQARLRNNAAVNLILDTAQLDFEIR